MTEKWIEGIPDEIVRPKKRVEVWRPTYHYPIEGALLGPNLYVLLRHYNPETRQPYNCPEPGHCPACKGGKTTYLTGWASASAIRVSQPFIFHFTQQALADLAEYRVKNFVGRGVLVRTIRTNLKTNSPMHAEFHGRDEREWLLPDFDPRETLENMWGVALVKLLRARDIGGHLAEGEIPPDAEGEVRE